MVAVLTPFIEQLGIHLSPSHYMLLLLVLRGVVLPQQINRVTHLPIWTHYSPHTTIAGGVVVGGRVPHEGHQGRTERVLLP